MDYSIHLWCESHIFVSHVRGDLYSIDGGGINKLNSDDRIGSGLVVIGGPMVDLGLEDTRGSMVYSSSHSTSWMDLALRVEISLWRRHKMIVL
jgi:hypothetical protein